MHVDFDPLKVDWFAFAESSPELMVQFGGYNVFRGIPYQRGTGVGSIFRSLLRYLVPIGKEIGSAIGRQGLETGNRVLTNVLQGQDLKQTLVNESKAGLKNLLEKAASNINAQKGQGGFDFKRYQKADALPASIGKKRQKHINRLQSTIGPPTFLPTVAAGKKKKKQNRSHKKLRIDSLGTY